MEEKGKLMEGGGSEWRGLLNGDVWRDYQQ